MKPKIDLERLKAFVELGKRGETTNVGYIYASVPDLIELLEEAQEMFDFQVTVGVTSKRVNEWRNRFEKKDGEK